MKKWIFLLVTVLVLGLFSGCCLIHDWQAATCTAPQTCTKCGRVQGETLSHRWEDATCTAPKTCSVCGTTEGTTLEHSWLPVTCEDPQTCEECGATRGEPKGHTWSDATCTTQASCFSCMARQGSPLGHSWVEATDTTPRMCEVCAEMTPMENPANGQVFIGAGQYGSSSLTIRGESGQACYVKLKDSQFNDVLSFYVGAGETAVVAVPRGYYYVYFAHGKDWYGTEYIFGEDTAYAKDPDLKDFMSYTWEYTLYPVYNGNFSEQPVSPEEF